MVIPNSNNMLPNDREIVHVQMSKLYRGTIQNYQIHILTLPEKQLVDMFPEAQIPPTVFTGTVVNDPSGRYQPGDHMRSSLVVALDKSTGMCETTSSKYNLLEEGNDIVPEMGNAVLDLFY